MAEDTLVKYQDLIDDLKLSLGDPQFDALFKRKTAHLSRPDQFLLKMEMSRLKQPVARFIDLRGQVSGEIKPYEYQGKLHFMDDTAIKVFERELKRYGGYTLAVYEAVMNTENNFRVIQRKAEQEKKAERQSPTRPLSTTLVRFAGYESRCEERMNYSIKITVELDGGDKFEASTSDISLSGCKIKLTTKAQLSKGQLIGIRLVGLEQDFELGLKNGIQYEVVAVESGNHEYNYIRLKRTFIENDSQFDEFLRSFIHGNKRRYKVNLDNTFEAVICKGYEQYYLPRVSSLFVFLSQTGEALRPSLCLTNENNNATQRYFNDETNQSVLYNILHPKRLAMLQAKPGAVKQSNLYTFTHTTGGKIYYYSATEEELERHPELKPVFYGFGSHKDSWQCFKIQLMPSLPEDAFIPLSLPSSAGKIVEKLNAPPSARVQSHIKDVKSLVLLTDITTEQEHAHFRNTRYNRADVNKLKVFGHAKHPSRPPLEVVALEYVNLRAQKRYLYKTDITLSNPLGEGYSGFSRDFSVMGLQMELHQPAALKKGDIVHLAAPELQRITKKHKLSDMPYEVMAVSKSGTTINLKAHQFSDGPHAGVSFFRQLIENNKNKLKVCEEEPKVPGLSSALRNMATKSLCQCPVYLQKDGGNITVGAIGAGPYSTPVHLLLRQYGLFGEHTDVSAIIKPEDIANVLLPTLKGLNRQDPPVSFDFYLRYDPKEDNLAKAIKSRCVPSDSQPDLFRPFVAKGIEKDIVFVMRLHLSRTGRPDTKYLANELRYISQYAMHKAKELESALWSVVGVGDFIDISDHALKLLDLDNTTLASMNKRKQIWMQRIS